MFKVKRCKGECPNCGRMNIDWEEGKIEEGGVHYIGRCGHCRQKFTECYGIEYSNTVYSDAQRRNVDRKG